MPRSSPKPTLIPSKTPRATLRLVADPLNPNRMKPEDKERMVKSLAEFGDLGGIIINKRTGCLVGGHQRVDALAGAILRIKDLSKPEIDGTVGRGWLYKGKHRYSVRVVDWPEAKAHAALLAANRFARVGSDDNQKLKDLLEELDTGATDMDLTGYDEKEIERLMTQIHQEQSEEADGVKVIKCPNCGKCFNA